MTPDEVHDVSFGKPPAGHRGYDQQSVDELLDRIEATLRGEASIGREELATTVLKRPRIGHHGYSADEVDAFLGRVLADWPET